MQRSCMFLVALLLCASLASAQQTSSSSRTGRAASTPQEKQNQSVSQTGSSNNQQEQNNPNGGSPSSSAPGRVTGETPTQVQMALDKQLPTGSDVTASVTDDGSLKLTGTVKTEADKAKAEQVARSVSGRKIDNKLQVGQGNQDQSSNPK
jgi:osmotically-inducible protein OsmY